MKYMMFVCVDEELATPEATREMAARPRRGWRRWTAAACACRATARADQHATTVRVRGGEVVIADGPFAETKEQIGGYDILECADLDEAIEVASKHPVARFGMLEVRPFAED